MAVFGLGTLPTMLGISLSGKLLPLALRLKLRHAIPFSVCLLAGLLILRGLALGIPYVSPIWQFVRTRLLFTLTWFAKKAAVMQSQNPRSARRGPTAAR